MEFDVRVDCKLRWVALTGRRSNTPIGFLHRALTLRDTASFDDSSDQELMNPVGPTQRLGKGAAVDLPSILVVENCRLLQRVT